MPSHPYSVAKTDTYSPSPSTHTLAYPNICLSQKVEIKIKDICASCISVFLTPLMHILKLISLSILPFPSNVHLASSPNICPFCCQTHSPFLPGLPNFWLLDSLSCSPSPQFIHSHSCYLRPPLSYSTVLCIFTK